MAFVQLPHPPPPETILKTQINLGYVLLLALTAALGGLLFGFDIAIIAGAGPFLTTHFNLTEVSMGVAFSSLLFGCALGALIAGYLVDHFGRRLPLLWVAVVFAVTCLAMGLAPTFNIFLLTRFLGGLAVGGASILAPMYIAEIAPPAMRGRMCTCYQLAIVVGIFFSFLLNYLLGNIPEFAWFNTSVYDLGAWNWRWMFISGVVPSIIFFFLIYRAPETPRYLYKAGRYEESFAILQRILGKEEAERETAEIKISFAAPKASWSELRQNQGLRKSLKVGFILAILIHFSGINTIIDYAPIIFKSAGFTMDAALFSTFGIGFVNLLFTLVSFWTIDRFGRKPLYIIGSIGMTVVLTTLGITILLGHFKGIVALSLILMYIAFFASCIGPVFWTLVPEIFPNRVRGEAMIVPVLVQWIANAIVVMLFPVAFKYMGQATTFFVLGAAALIQVIYTWRCVPETKGKHLRRSNNCGTRVDSFQWHLASPLFSCRERPPCRTHQIEPCDSPLTQI